MSSKPEPDWRSTGGSGKAHLLDRTRLESRAWCGANLMHAVAAGFEERCKNCLTAVEGYLVAAQEAVPDTITDTVVIEVRRGVNQRELFSRVCTWLASGNNHHLEISHVFGRKPLTDAEITELVSQVQPGHTESLRYMHNQRGRRR